MVEVYATRMLKEDKTSNTKNVLRARDGISLVKSIIHENLKIEEKNIIFEQDLYGKPYLVNDCDFHFNISHSGIWIVCAISKKPVGIDIELIEPKKAHVVEKIADRFFSKEECADISSKEVGKRLYFFYEMWTLKESFIKAIGKGLAIPLDSFIVKIEDSGPRLENNLGDEYTFKQYDLDKNYKVAVCSTENHFSSQVTIKELA